MSFEIEAELWAQPLPLRSVPAHRDRSRDRRASSVSDRRSGAAADGSAPASVLQPRAAAPARDGRRVRARVPQDRRAARPGHASSAPTRTSSGCSRASPSSPRACSCKIDAEFPRFTQHLLEIVYPHYLAPTPSMAVVQLQPEPDRGGLAAGLPRAARQRAAQRCSAGASRPPCEYRTGARRDAVAARADATPSTPRYVGDVGDARRCRRSGARAALRLQAAHHRGADVRRAGARRRCRCSCAAATSCRCSSTSSSWRTRSAHGGAAGDAPVALAARGAPTTPMRPVGFDDDEALLPYGAALVPGLSPAAGVLRVPAALLFVELTRAARRRCGAATAPSSRSSCCSTATTARWTASSTPSNFALFCTPAINLFPRRADRIHLTDATQRVPRGARPHAADGLRGPRGRPRSSATASAPSSEQRVPAVLRLRTTDADRRARRPTTRCSASRACCRRASAQRGPRSSYIGSEVFLSLVDADEAPYRRRPAPAGDRDAVHQPRSAAAHAGRPGTHRLHAGVGAPVESVRCLAGPTPPRASLRRRRHRLAADQPSVAELPVAGRQPTRGAGRGGAARAAGAVRRLDRRRARASRSRACASIGVAGDHARAAGARADHLRPRPGDHA